MKGIIVYKGKYGATKQYAEWLGQDLGYPTIDADLASAVMLKRYDCVIIGSSVYIGKLQVKNWMKEYADFLKTKKVFVFVVCATPAHERAKLDEIYNSNIRGLLLKEPKTFFLRGRMQVSKLSWLDRFLLKMGARLQKDAAARNTMVQDFDDMKQENLLPLEKAVRESYPEPEPA